MSNSRFKNSQPPQRGFQGERNRNREAQMYLGEHSGQQLNRSEQERYGGQGGYEGGYGGSQGAYGRRGGYQQNNFPQGIHEESDFSFGSDYIHDARAYRPSRMSRQTGSRSWIGVGDSSYGGDQGGRSYSSTEYNENPSYVEDGPGQEYSGGQSETRFGTRWMPRRGGFGGPGSGQDYGQSSLPRQSFAGRGPQGYKRSDERIAEDINEHLTQDHDVDASDISVESKDGEVVLKGTVSDRESKRRAEEIAESCSGVKDVQNQLRIKRQDFSESNYEPKRDKSDDKRTKAS